jgi:ABC-type uncharacterized transport system substrate-binding protein
VAEFFRQDIGELLRGAATRGSLVVMLAILSGCSIFTPVEPPPQPPPELPPVIEPEPEPEPQNIEPLVAVVISDETPAYVEVAAALGTYLDEYQVYDLSDRGLAARDAFGAISESGATAIVAIGLPAARAARRFSTVPVVLSQVFNLQDAGLLSEEVKAVAVLPPMALQIEAWQSLDPTVRNIGAILGPGHEELVAEAEAALEARGVKFHHAVAQSDRETLYLFNRLVRDIDGFILFPDNRILSRSVLAEMMSYASRHRVQIAVFNEPLLEHGAAFSAGTVEADIAAKIATVLDQAINGRWDEVPPITPLSQIEVMTNPEVLQRLGLVQPDDGLDDKLADMQ